MSLPMGQTKDFTSRTSFRGFSFDLGKYVTDELAVDLRFSWHVFYEDLPTDSYVDGTTTITGKKYNYINSFPMTLGLKYIMNSGSHFSPYGGAGIGAYKIDERTDMGIYTDETRQWHFGAYPEIGFVYEFSYGVGLNVFARYDYAFKAGTTTSHSYLTFGIGFHFMN